MASILENIVTQTREDLSKIKQQISLKDLESFDDFERERKSLKQSLAGDLISVIAEIKKASPSKGVIRNDFDPLKHAESYVKGGASALSVLTDKPFFKGDLKYLQQVSREVEIPVLRKDFIIDPYQIKEARAYGADAVLIIVTITEGDQLNELIHASKEFGLEALVECYSQNDLDRIDFEQVPILGVNNRDLNTFDVDVHRGIELLQQSTERTVKVSESGLSKPSDLHLLQQQGIHAALIGEYFMRQPDPGLALNVLLEETRSLIEKNNNESAHA